MNFGVNNSLNTEAKQVGISHNLGSSNLKLPHILSEGKTETKTDSMKRENNIRLEGVPGSADIDSTQPSLQSQHENNLIIFMVFGGAIAWFLFR